MSFGSNILFYRKKYGITQEALAEKLEVTRQTISRWETDSAFPDMEKLLILCDLFRCDMETLVRGDAAAKDSVEYKANLEAYDKHMNSFSAQITAGVCMILAGVTTMLFLASAGVKEVAGVVTLLSCITVAVAFFVAGGIAHENFRRENPRMEKYPESTVRAFRRKLPYFIAGATALILIGVIAVVAMTYREDYAPAGFTREEWESFAAGVLLLAVTIAVGLYVYSGMQSGKYDVKNYNRECTREGDEDLDTTGGTGENSTEDLGVSAKSRAEKGERISSAVCGAIMLTATAVYLPIGFVWNLWHPGWVVFPVGGILCAIVSLITQAIFGKK